jgi:large subunit ribosomal protein L25
MDELTLKLSPRTVTGKNVKRLRRNGVVPVHLYGSGTEPLSLQVEARVLRRTLRRAGANIPLEIEVEGRDGANTCFVREVQRHPVTEEVLHVDFLRVDVSRLLAADVPIVLDGVAPAAFRMGGTLLQALQSLRVESLPMNIPTSFHLDVSDLDTFEKSLRVSDIDVRPEVTVLTDPGEMIARVMQPRIEEEEPEEAVEGEEGLEEPEAEASEAEQG